MKERREKMKERREKRRGERREGWSSVPFRMREVRGPQSHQQRRSARPCHAVREMRGIEVPAATSVTLQLLVLRRWRYRTPKAEVGPAHE